MIRSLSAQAVRRPLWIILAIYWLLIFALTHLPSPDLPHISLNDKLEHFLAYGALGGLLYLYLWVYHPNWSQIGIIVLAVGMSYGAIDEWLQALPIIHRDCDFLDWTTDTAALAVAAICMTFIRWWFTQRAPVQPLATSTV